MKRILLVDDDESVLKSLSVLLVSEGYEVVALTGGAETKEKVDEEDFDLLVVDIRMDPVDGMEVMAYAHDRKPDLPIIVISAYSSDEIAERSFELGCKAYIRKPFKIEDVLATVDEILGNADGS